MIWLGLTSLIALSFSSVAPVSGCKTAPHRDSGLVYGQGYAFVLAAPPGWVMDTDSGASDGAKAVFYPRGSSWEGSTVMYAQVGIKDDPEYQTLPRIVKNVEGEMKVQSPGVIIHAGIPMMTDSKQRAVVRYLSKTVDHSWEAVAFIDQSGFFTELVLSAKTQAQFKATLPKFRRLVSSYNSVGGGVKINRTAPPVTP